MKRPSRDKNPYPAQYRPQGSMIGGHVAMIGHLTLLWNYIESVLDWSFDHAIESHHELRVAVRSRINGLEGKYEIIKASIAVKDRFKPEEVATLRDTLGCFMPYKRARDAIIHVRIGSMKNDIAPTYERSGQAFEVLLSVPAIATVVGHLEHYQNELAQLQYILFWRRMARPTATQACSNPKHDKLAEQHLQNHFGYLRKHQEKRKSLPSLPEFPPEALLAVDSAPQPPPPAGGAPQ